jgi:tRNA threonylcarbamoyladenosine biosynthesis protein TsaE
VRDDDPPLLTDAASGSPARPEGSLTVASRSPGETRGLGRRLGLALSGGETILLIGGLGAGKTVLVQGIAEGLGVEGPVTSPTYTYQARHAGRLVLLHSDLYRVEGEDDLDDLGWEEAGNPGAVLAVEWGERIGPYRPAECLVIRIEGVGDLPRSVTLEAWGEAPLELLEAV